MKKLVLIALVTAACGGSEPSAQVPHGAAFANAKNDIGSQLLKWPSGAGMVMRVRNGHAEQRIVLVTATHSKPTFLDDSQTWAFAAMAMDDNKISGVFILAVRQMKAGTYEDKGAAGGGGDMQCMLGLRIGDSDIKSPSMGWSRLGGGCKVALTDAAIPGHYDVTFSVQLANEGKDESFTIEDGYAHLVK
jgi:hypothetical protein